MALTHPTPDRLQKIIEFYDEKGHFLFVSSEKGRITGVIGVDDTQASHGWIVHLAVHPDFRMRGIARGLIEQTIKTLSLKGIALETDQEAVGFYRACGFEIEEIASPWVETRRYRCIKGHMPENVTKYYDKLKI